MNKLLLCGLGVLALFISGCGKEQEQKGQMALPVTTMTLKKADLPLTLEFNGQTVSDLDVVVRAKVSGTIEEQFFAPGQAVSLGDRLYKIDEAKYKAVFESAQGSYQAALSQSQKAQADYARAKSLRAKNAIAQKDYDAAIATLNQAEANVKTAQANMKNAQIDLEYSQVTAPFDGVVGDTRKDVGSLASVGDELVRLSKFDPIFVKFGVSDITRLDIDNNLANGAWKRLQPSVSIIINGQEQSGSLVFIDNVINQNTATVDAKAIFDNKNGLIRPGIYTKVKVYGFYAKDSFAVPQSAISQDIKGSYVYLYNNGVVDKKYIKIASEDGNNYIVSSGLNDGDVLILDNFKKIRQGAKVQIVEQKALNDQNDSKNAK
ncbi:MAG: multidrug efflux system CmeABC, periplasmic fusion protein CmeA [Candidatus Campylobacter infans]|nr:MAG: multidrug efflux system CmeABC, periplasmic fusion protein CmeA [Candidatus Campylobacter infans]